MFKQHHNHLFYIQVYKQHMKHYSIEHLYQKQPIHNLQEFLELLTVIIHHLQSD
jgi:hypothetical protein